MCTRSLRISAVFLAVLMVISCIAVTPSSSADDAQYGEYGAVYSFDYLEFDDAVQSVTGKYVEEWITYIFDELGGYDVDAQPDLYAKFATTRDTVQTDDVYTMIDHTSGYVSAGIDMKASGSFPMPGTYERAEGEGSIQFIKRVFKDESGGFTRNVSVWSSIQLYIDMDLVTHVDMGTGYVTDSYLTLKFAYYEDTDRDISIDFTEDAQGNISTISVNYDKVKVDNNFYNNTEVAFAVEDMPVFVGDEHWTIDCSVTEHVNKLVISSDLANSIWLKAVDMSDGDKDQSKLPELILELLGSGGRMLDLFETIRSLTGSSMSDITFLDVFNASQHVDARGYRYSRLVSVREGGPTFDLPRAAYTLDYATLSQNILSGMVDEPKKLLIGLFFIAIGWNDIDVRDISDDTAAKEECSEVREYVDAMIEEDNYESYSVPTVYVYTASGGIIISAVLILLIWRRLI